MFHRDIRMKFGSGWTNPSDLCSDSAFGLVLAPVLGVGPATPSLHPDVSVEHRGTPALTKIKRNEQEIDFVSCITDV